MSRYQITIPGFEDNPHGADYHPDEFETFEGTEAELLAYIESEETRYQTKVAIRNRNPGISASTSKHTLLPDALSQRTWGALSREAWSAPCDRWCRAVVEVRELSDEEDVIGCILMRAKENARDLANARIAEVEAQFEVADRAAASKVEEAERAQLAALLAKFPDVAKGGSE